MEPLKPLLSFIFLGEMRKHKRGNEGGRGARR
jgi:hypothetical protein